MKHSCYLLLLFGILFLFSCSVEKRLYRPGFYVSNKSIKQEDANKRPAIENSDEIIIGPREKLEEEFADDIISSDSQKSISLYKSDSLSGNETHSSIIAPTKHTSIVSNFVKNTTTEASRARSNGYADVFILLGIIVGLLGLALLVISAATVNTYPPLSNSLFLIGLIVLVVGIILAGIGDPSIFLDVLFGILDAL